MGICLPDGYVFGASEFGGGMRRSNSLEITLPALGREDANRNLSHGGTLYAEGCVANGRSLVCEL